MQCPFYSSERYERHALLEQMNSQLANRILNDSTNCFYIRMGKQPEYASFQDMVQIWLVSGDCISRLYGRALIGKQESDPAPHDIALM